MAKKEFEHFVKPLAVKETIEGLYPKPRIWMEGKDMEGFNANVRFQPINVYTPEDAPSDEHFIAFVGAERLRQKNGGYLWLYKNARGIILDDSNGSKTKGQEYSLPKDALLTSIDEWQKFNKGEQAAA